MAAWQKAHANNRLELAHYQTEKDPYETDFMRANRWCAASVNRRPVGVVRTALFYVPAVSPGALPPLPEKEAKSLIRACKMQALWYETPATVSNEGDAASSMRSSGSYLRPGGNRTDHLLLRISGAARCQVQYCQRRQRDHSLRRIYRAAAF